GYESDSARVGRHGHRHGAVVGEGNARRQAVRYQAVVQRHVRADEERLAVRVWAGGAAAQRTVIVTASRRPRESLAAMTCLPGASGHSRGEAFPSTLHAASAFARRWRDWNLLRSVGSMR